MRKPVQSSAQTVVKNLGKHPSQKKPLVGGLTAFLVYYDFMLNKLLSLQWFDHPTSYGLHKHHG